VPAIVSAVTTSGVLTVDLTTGFDVTESVRLTGTAFGGLQLLTTYWIIALDPVLNTITLSASLYGTAISVSGGTGSMTLVAYRQLGPGAGNTITANTTGDFNTIQAIAAKVMGPPTDSAPTYGYNQTVLSAQVPLSGSGDARIYQNNWSNLAQDLIKARIHQTGDVNIGNTLPIPTTTNIVSEAFRKNYYDFAQIVLANANTVAGNQTAIPTNGVGSAARATVWNGNIQSTATLDFGSQAGARAFFNAGGYISVACTLSGSFGAKSASKDNTWSGMFGHMGTVYIGPNSTYTTGGIPTAGYTSTPTNIGFFQLTTTAQTLFTETPPSLNYAANSLRVRAYMDGTFRYMYLIVQFNDDAAVTAGTPVFYAGDEYVDGILTNYISCRRASGSNVSLPPPGITFAGDLTNMGGAPSLYGLSASAYYVNEGSTFTVSLQTQNVNEGTVLYYTVSGFPSTPNNVARYTASATYFTVSGGGASLSFTIVNDLYTDGQTTMTIALNNGLASVSVNVNETSVTPAGMALITGANSVYGSGSSYYSNNVFTVPPGIYELTLYMVGGGGGAGNYAGGGGGAGQVRGGLSAVVTPGQRLSVLLGNGGGQGAAGATTQFGSFQALGGSAGGNGSGWTGGAGGQSGAGQPGGAATANSTQQAFTFDGGGGGGASGAGTNQTGGTGYNYDFIVKYDNWYVSWGGGGEGGSAEPDQPGSTGATGGGGQGGGPNPGGHPKNGQDGAPNTGGGGGGGDAGVATPHGITSANAAITGYSGGAGGSGMVIVKWGP
jgi:hypothetical protein